LLVLAHARNDTGVAEQGADSRRGHVDRGGNSVVGEAVGFEERDAVVAWGELFDRDT